MIRHMPSSSLPTGTVLKWEKNTVILFPLYLSLSFLSLTYLKWLPSSEFYCRHSTQQMGNTAEKLFPLQGNVTAILLSLLLSANCPFLEGGKNTTEVCFYECPKPSKLTVRTLWSLYTAVLRADVALLSFGIKYSLASFQAKNYLST